MSVTISGMAQLMAALQGAQSNIDDALKKSVTEVCADLLGESQPLVPVDTAALVGSGSFDVEQVGDTVQGSVGYNTPYALKVHEDRTMNHPNGGQAKYLTDPFEQRKDKYREKIRQDAQRALGGG